MQNFNTLASFPKDSFLVVTRTKWASTRENLSSVLASNKDADKPAHPRSLIIAFVIRFLESIIIEPVHEISNNVVCATSSGSDQPAHTRSLIRAFASRLNIL